MQAALVKTGYFSLLVSFEQHRDYMQMKKPRCGLPDDVAGGSRVRRYKTGDSFWLIIAIDFMCLYIATRLALTDTLFFKGKDECKTRKEPKYV